jgi:hypothetical protein
MKASTELNQNPTTITTSDQSGNARLLETVYALSDQNTLTPNEPTKFYKSLLWLLMVAYLVGIGLLLFSLLSTSDTYTFAKEVLLMIIFLKMLLFGHIILSSEPRNLRTQKFRSYFLIGFILQGFIAFAGLGILFGIGFFEEPPSEICPECTISIDIDWRSISYWILYGIFDFFVPLRVYLHERKWYNFLNTAGDFRSLEAVLQAEV